MYKQHLILMLSLLCAMHTNAFCLEHRCAIEHEYKENHDMNVESIVTRWQTYARDIPNWQSLVEGITPRKTGCGLVYELANPFAGCGESFAIVDMRNIKISEPHYHGEPEVEIYIALQGAGLVVVGGKEHKLSQRSPVIIPPNKAHFVIPDDLVIAVINVPCFKPGNYMVLTKSNASVGFDYDQFLKLSKIDRIETSEK